MGLAGCIYIFAVLVIKENRLSTFECGGGVDGRDMRYRLEKEKGHEEVI